MEKDCRREPEGEIDRCRERERQNEEERALELEQERHDRQREEKTDEAPCAEIVGSSRRAPSTSNPAISLSNVNKDRCIVLDNVFDGTVEREDEFYLGIRNHLHRNSVRCGPVHHIHVDRKCGRVFMLFDCARSANKAAEKWHQTMGKLHTNFASRDIEEDDLSEDNEESFCNPVSKDNVRDSNFDKALIEFYMKNKVKSLKRKIMQSNIRDNPIPAYQVSYLDSVEFGLNSLPDEYPRILVWKGNRIRQYSEMDKNSSNSFGKRPLKRLVPASVYQVERSFGKDSYKKFSKTFSSPFNLNGKLKALFSSFLTNEVIDDIVQIIHTNNIGKPKDFEAWSHSLVCDVLSCLQNSQHAPEPSCSNNSIDIPETEGISKPPMVDSFQANNGKLVPILNEGNGCVVDVNVPVQPDVATKVLSPIVPIRLSNVFNQQVSQNDFVNLVETILRYNGNNGDIVQTAFEGANSAFLLWRSDQMQFPIVIANHWFLFVVCLKAKVFAFCDSLYDEGDPFHNAFREPLVKL
ncbi:hypothetical protein ACQ4PT_059170 [Festuca glaucescens]